MFCKYCGKEIDKESSFCAGCGKPVDKNNSKENILPNKEIENTQKELSTNENEKNNNLDEDKQKKKYNGGLNEKDQISIWVKNKYYGYLNEKDQIPIWVAIGCVCLPILSIFGACVCFSRKKIKQGIFYILLLVLRGLINYYRYGCWLVFYFI